MRTIKLTISYDGTRYKGWQVQNNGNTVQAELEKAIEKITCKHSRVHGAGRTDAGVHAKGQVAHFRTNSPIPLKKIPIALNSVLPDDIVVSKAEQQTTGFHAQYDARRKRYRYCMINSGRRDPFRERYAYRVNYKLDIPLMITEAQELLGEHDFRAFQARDKRERSSVRRIYKVDIKKRGTGIFMDIEGNGFLYNMVRNIAGTLLDIGRGRLSRGSMRKIIDSKDRAIAGPTAPAKGLFLMEVRY